MIDTHLTYFDLAVLSVMVLSCLFAFFRGFIRELLSLGAWIGAGLVTLYYFRDVAAMMKSSVKNDMVAGGLATLGLYILCLFAFTLINSLIMRLFKDSGEVGVLDNALGLAFGAFRGAFLISLAYFLMTIFISENTEPSWLKHSTTQPWVERGAVALGQAAPDYMVEHTSLKSKIDKAQGRKLEEEEDELDDKKDKIKHGDDGEDSKALDSFMDTLNKENNDRVGR